MLNAEYINTPIMPRMQVNLRDGRGVRMAYTQMCVAYKSHFDLHHVQIIIYRKIGWHKMLPAVFA